MAGYLYREFNVLVKMYAAFAPSPQSRILRLDLPRCLPFRRRGGLLPRRQGSDCHTNTTRYYSFARSRMVLNCRLVFRDLHSAEMLEPRSGVREHLEERARRIIFLMGMSLLVAASSSEPEFAATNQAEHCWAKSGGGGEVGSLRVGFAGMW